MTACFIVNPTSGNGAGGRANAIIEKVMGTNADVRRTTVPGEATKLAIDAANDGCDPVVAVGGDGTVMEVVHGLMQLPDRPRMGIVPVGNGNDFCRMAGIPSDPVKAIQRIGRNEVTRVDVGVCNGRHFLNVAGSGLDTEVAAIMASSAPSLLRNPAGYLLYGVRELFRFSNPAFEIWLDDERVETRGLLVAVANGRYFAGGMNVCPEADPSDGWLEVCIGGDLSRFEALSLIPRIYFGRHTSHPKVRMARCREVHIAAPEGLVVQLDGEVVERLPARFRVIPGAIELLGVASDRLA